MIGRGGEREREERNDARRERPGDGDSTRTERVAKGVVTCHSGKRSFERETATIRAKREGERDEGRATGRKADRESAR